MIANPKRTINYLGILFSITFLSGCLTIKEGTSEKDYFKTVVDLNVVVEVAEGTNDSFDSFKLRNDFYKTNGKRIVSSDATTEVNMRYFDTGDVTKPAILFVHGTPADWWDFWPFLVMSDLKKNAHLASADRPGWAGSFCKTTAGKKCFNPLLKQQSKYYDSLIKKLDAQNNHQGVILVGWSLGGPLIGQLAFDYPEYVKGLIFIASPFDPELSQPRWYNYFSQVFAWFMPDDLERSNDEMMPLAKELQEMDDVWASIDVPIWVIQGSIDDLVNRGNLDYSKNLFAGKDAQYIEVETSGHYVMYERMSVVVESINQALEKLASGKAGETN